MPNYFKMPQTPKTRPVPARSVASLRSSPLYTTPPGFTFIFVAISRGSAPYGAPPPGYCMAPLRGSEFGSLALADYPTNASSNSDLSNCLQSTKNVNRWRKAKRRQSGRDTQRSRPFSLSSAASSSTSSGVRRSLLRRISPAGEVRVMCTEATPLLSDFSSEAAVS